MNTRFAATRRVLPGSPFNVAPADLGPVEHFAIDDRVTHDRYGLGTVVKVEGEVALQADFGHGIVRRITLPSTKLSKL
ncbi:MAG: hypothetical protein GEV10_30075 [Streptosporangiales bacterium]|nr:hypothetical protein [Streptosporangiales bacterium]